MEILDSNNPWAVRPAPEDAHPAPPGEGAGWVARSEPTGHKAIRESDLRLDASRLRLCNHVSGRLALVYFFDGPAPLVLADPSRVVYSDEPGVVGFVLRVLDR